MSKSAALIRTNPILTSNVKITIDDNNAYLNSFDADQFLSENRFKDKRISYGSYLENDIFRFWENGQTPLDYVFRVGKLASDNNPIKSYDLQCERLYSYGAEVNLSKTVKKRLKIFAPIYTTGKIPSKFLIFRLPNPSEFTYTENPTSLVLGVQYKVITGSVVSDLVEHVSGDIFSATSTTFQASIDAKFIICDSSYEDSTYDVKLLMDKADIIKTYDLVDSEIGKYLNNYLTGPAFPETPIHVDFNGREIQYTGIDIKSGVMCTKPETFAPHLGQLTEVLEFEDYVTQGFSRNGLLIPNILNLEFCFDDDTVNSANRYFGLYCDDVDFGNLNIDLIKQFRDTYKQNHLFSKSIPNNFDRQISDASGIKIQTSSIDGFSFEDFSVAQKNAFYYYSNTNGVLSLLEKENVPLVLRKTSVSISDMFALGNMHELSVLPFKDSLDNGSLIVVGEFNVGERIVIRKNGIPVFEIIADTLPSYTDTEYGPGQNVARFFWPNGVKTEVARAITAALNYVLSDETLQVVQYEDMVLIYQLELGGISQGYTIESSSQAVNINFSHVTGGGFDDVSRVKMLEPVDQDKLIGKYLKTKIGYSKITNISRIYSPKKEPTIANKEDIERYVCVAIENDGDEIIVQNGKVHVYDVLKPKIGALSVCDICDFDFDTFTSDYNRSYSNEYKRYFDTQSGQLVAVAKSKIVLQFTRSWGAGSGFNLTVSVAGPPSTVVNYVDPGLLSDHDILNDIINSINAIPSGCKASLLDGYRILLDVTLGPITTDKEFILTPSGGFVISLDSAASYDANFPEYYVLYQIGPAPAVIEMFDGTTYTQITGSPTGVDFVALSSDYRIVSGTPRIIARKFEYPSFSYIDKELQGFSGFNVLSIKTNPLLNPTLKNKIDAIDLEPSTEYDQLSENQLQKNILRSKTVPHISKWIRQDSRDIRDNEYRLNLSLAFNEFGFSPSSYDKSQNPKFFTHEWFYMGGLPGKILNSDLVASTSYFDKRFDVEKHKDELHDYFTEYFTVENLRGFGVPRQQRYSAITKQDNGFLTFFKGSIFNFSNPDGSDYSNYKFSCVLNLYRTYPAIKRYPLTYRIIDNKDHKNIVVVIDLVVDDHKVVPYVSTRNFTDTIEHFDEIYYEYLYMYCMRSVNTARFVSGDFPHPGYRITYPNLLPSVAGVFDAGGGFENYFEGIKLNISYRRVSNTAPDTAEFDNSRIPVSNLLKENDSRDYGYLYAVDASSKTMFAVADNDTMGPLPPGPGPYYRTGTSTISLISENLVFAKISPYFYAVAINGASVMAGDRFIPSESLFDLSSLEWYQNGGGKDYYVGISQYLSFAGFVELLNNNSNLIEKTEIKDGASNTSNLNIVYMAPDMVTMDTRTEITEQHQAIPEHPDVNVPVLTSKSMPTVPYALFRYSGNYEPKLKQLIRFTSKMVEQPSFEYTKSWNNSYYHRIDDTKGKTMDLSYVLNTNTNFFWDEFADKHKDMTEFIHKRTFKHFPKVKAAVIDGRIPQEISIISKKFNIIKPYISRDYFLADESVGVFGGENVNDIKSYLATPIFLTEDTISSVIPSILLNGDINNEIAVYTETTSEILISINLFNFFKSFYFDKVKSAWEAYLDQSSMSKAIDVWIADYIKQNLFYRYDFTDVVGYQKTSPVISGFSTNTETEKVKLLAAGFLQTKSINSSFDKSIPNVINMTIKKVNNSGIQMNLKLSFVHK